MALPKITDVERTVVHVPYRERCAPWNALLASQWGIIEVLRLATEDPDVVGWGETVLAFTPKRVTDESVARVIGTNPADHLWDASLGAGLQMALFDAVGKAAGVPAYRLLGHPQVRDRCPIAWWNTKMPPEVLAAEAADAVAHGYRVHKFKARPWFDVYEQVAQVTAATPDEYVLDIDWNAFLRDHATAVRVLSELDRSARTNIYESPIPPDALEDYRRLRERLDRPVAEHFVAAPYAAGIQAQAFDGYVLTPNAAGGGVGGLMRQGTLADAFGKSGWVQWVGAGLTTALTLHVTSILPAARWPLVTAMNTYAEDLLARPLTVTAGLATVPEGPGLGVQVDEEALSRLEMDPPHEVKQPRRILTFGLPDGRSRHYATVQQLWTDCRTGNMPAQERGAALIVREDDGSADFVHLFDRATHQPVWDVADASR